MGASHQLKTGFENWWTPTGTDTFNIFQDHRLRVTGPAATCNPTVRTGCTPSEVYLFNTPLTQKTKMRNFAAFVQDRISYQRFTLNLGVRWAYYDGTIPAQGNGGSQWASVCAACNQTFPEIKTPYNWNTIAPRTGVVWKVTEDGKNVVKASYSRYYEGMYTTEFSSINGNGIVGTGVSGGGVATFAWAGDLNGNGRADIAELRNPDNSVPASGVPTAKAVFTARQNAIDPNLKNPRNDEIMFAFQRELANNWSLSVDWIQRWFNDYTIDQNCYGLPCAQTASTAYLQNRVVTDFGADNLTGTGDDRSVTLFNVAPALPGERHDLPHQLRQQHVDCLHAEIQGVRALNRQADVQQVADAGFVRVVAARRRSRARLHQPEQRAAVRWPGPRRSSISRTPSSCSAATRRPTASPSARTTRRSRDCRSIAC